MKMPKISIVIPIYNVEEYLEECLLSVMRQTYTGGIECILVDDCGNDNSIYIAQKLISEYNGNIVFRILHHERNRGLSAARNTGTDAVTGDYIYYLDSDDYISDDCIEVLTAPLLEKEYDMVMGDYEMFGNRHDPTLLKEPQSELIGNEMVFSSYANRKIYVMAWNKLCRTSFLHDNNITFLEGQLHEDELWTYKTMRIVKSLRIKHKIIYHYRVRANSIATDVTRSKEKLSSYYDTIEYIQMHPYPDMEIYKRCLFYYWGLYLSIAFASQQDFLHSYIRLRRTCPYRPLKHILFGQMTIAQIKGRVHFALPPIIAFYYLKLRTKPSTH